MSAHKFAEYDLDDTLDDASTILDAADDGRASFDQDTIASDFGGQSVQVTEYASRLDLGNLNLVSWKTGARRVYLGSSETEHGVSNVPDARPRLKFHAISDLVCHPAKTPAPLRGSRKPLPPTTSGPPPIPRPPPDGFYQPYLDSINKPGTGEEESGVGSLWNAWDQARRGIKPKTEVSVTPSSSNAFEPEQLPDLSAVSPLFFDPDFDLAKPLIWQFILGSDEASDNATSIHAQDDLSHQLDVLESNLVSEIRQRTPSFFSALSNLQSLTDQTSSCLNRLTSLRDELAKLDRSTAIKGLSIVDKQEQLHVARMTERAMSEVESVVGTLEIVRQVANEGDWVGALEGLEDVGRWWLRFSRNEQRRTGMGSRRDTDSHDGATNGDVALHTGKHVLDLVKEEDEEDVSSSTKDSPGTSNPAPPLLPLADLPAIQYFPEEMSSIAQTIQNQLELSFASICAAVLDNTPPIELIGEDEQDGEHSAAKKPETQMKHWRIRKSEEERLRSSFEGQIRGILHTFWRTDIASEGAPNNNTTTNPSRTVGNEQTAGGNSTSSITRIENVWRLAVLKSIKEGMRQLLQLGSDGEADATDEMGDVAASGPAKGQSLVDTLKDMSHERFVTISEKIYETMVARIELVRILGEVLNTQLEKTKPAEPSIISQVIGGHPMSTVSAKDSTGFIEAILHSAVDLANARASKILLTRTEIHAELDLGKFVDVYDSAWQFILWSEALVGRVVGSLRGVVVSQARAFLVKYHSARLQESAKLVEEEQWIQVEVPGDAQQVVDLLLRSAMTDPAEFYVGRSSAVVENGSTGKQVTGSIQTKSSDKTLKIEDQTFNIVSATLRSVVLLQDYAKVVVSLDVIVSDTMNRIVEYLKSFNSRTCQVVLGAGAMRSAGLKNITAKHLALASQSLSIIISLTPYIREFIRRHLNPKQAVVLIEFDKLKRDYQEHQYEIHAKLISIMADRLTVHCGTLRGIDWESKPSTPINGYMEQLVKEITTLHKVLNKYLSAASVHSIMGRVLDATNEKLSEEYSKIEFKSEDSKKRMLQDVSYIMQRTSSLTEPSLPSPVAPLEELVKAKPTPRRAVQMSSALNGLLRRKNDAGGSSTTSLQDTASSAGPPTENDDSQIEDEEDALATSDVPPDHQEQPARSKADGPSEEPVPAQVLPTEGADEMADSDRNGARVSESNQVVNGQTMSQEQDLPQERDLSVDQEAPRDTEHKDPAQNQEQVSQNASES